MKRARFRVHVFFALRNAGDKENTARLCVATLRCPLTTGVNMIEWDSLLLKARIRNDY